MSSSHSVLADKLSTALQTANIAPQADKTSTSANVVPQGNNLQLVVTKPKATKADRVTKEAQFTAVTVAAFGYAQSRAAIVSAIAAAGGAQTEVQRRFHIGYIAYRLNLGAKAIDADMMHVAAVALSSMNAKPLPKGVKQSPKQSAESSERKGKRVRSTDEQRAYDASRTAWSQILKGAGIKSAASRGGARKPRPGKNEKDAADKPGLVDVSKASPGFDNLPAMHDFVLMQAMMLLRTCNKNAKIASPQITSAVSDFVAAVKACKPE